MRIVPSTDTLGTFLQLHDPIKSPDPRDMRMLEAQIMSKLDTLPPSFSFDVTACLQSLHQPWIQGGVVVLGLLAILAGYTVGEYSQVAGSVYAVNYQESDVLALNDVPPLQELLSTPSPVGDYDDAE